MSKRTILFTSIAVVVFLSGAAQAELVSFSSDVTYSWSPGGAVVMQGISTLASPSVITMNAQANSSFTLNLTVVNESAITWTGYELTLDPFGYVTFVAGTAGSTKFGTIEFDEQQDPCTLKFWAPVNVLPTQTVGLQFDIYIPGGSPHTFELTQQPIPEPATVALLGLGAAVLLTRRKRQ